MRSRRVSSAPGGVPLKLGRCPPGEVPRQPPGEGAQGKERKQKEAHPQHAPHRTADPAPELRPGVWRRSGQYGLYLIRGGTGDLRTGGPECFGQHGIQAGGVLEVLPAVRTGLSVGLHPRWLRCSRQDRPAGESPEPSTARRDLRRFSPGGAHRRSPSLKGGSLEGRQPAAGTPSIRRRIFW